MIKLNSRLIKLCSIILVCFFILPTAFSVNANGLEEEVDEQMKDIDLSQIYDFMNNNDELLNFDFFDSVNKMLSGDFKADYSDILSYIFNMFFQGIASILPTICSMIAIALLCAVIRSIKGSILSESITETVFFVCFLAEITLILGLMTGVYEKVSDVIKNISLFNEILSPILLTLMVASGGSVTASIFQPAVIFFSNGVINIIILIVLPLICLIFVFNVLSNFSAEINLTKFAECAASVIKWILGIVFIVFGLFLTVQGIAGGIFDSISVKATKFALSNSVPIVGGFLKDSFDLVASGSILIKNAVGIGGILVIFYIVLTPLTMLIGVSLMLKLCSGLIEPISDKRISNLCSSASKTISYLSAVLIISCVLFFITVLLMIVCGNAAIV